MLASFGQQTLTGVAQPLFGDLLTAALPIAPEGVDPIVPVANTAIYQPGYRIIIDPRTASADSLRVVRIITATTMQCSYESAKGHPHATGAVIMLAIACADIIVNTTNNGVNMWIAGDNTVTAAGGGNAGAVVYVNSPFRYAGNVPGNNVFNTSDLWIAGQAGSQYIAGAVVI